MSRARQTYNLIAKLWPLGKVANILGSRPVLSSLLRPCFSTKDNEAIILPVHEAVQGTESVVLPFQLLTPLIEQASARTLLAECICRRGERCQTYPREPGCLILGDGAAQVDPAIGHRASVEEALAHAQQAMGAGLVPLVVHSSFDAWILSIPYRRMLAVCFCCDCCCTVRQGLRLGPSAFWDTVVRLPGLEVDISPACTGCGECAGVCHVGAISLDDGGTHIGKRCKGCGRCAAVCPVGAITLRVAEGVDMRDRLLARIERRTAIGPARG